MPLKFWSYAMRTTTYLKNKLPIKVLKLASPYELKYHRQPTYKYFKVFDTLCLDLHFVFLWDMLLRIKDTYVMILPLTTCISVDMWNFMKLVFLSKKL